MSAAFTALPEKATHRRTRTFNQQLVLRAIYDEAPTSRADVARMTGLTRTSVSELVSDLIAEGLVEEIGRGQSSGGKAPILMRVIPEGRHLIALDLGESAFNGAVVNLRGEILAHERRSLEGHTGEQALALVFELVDALRADARRPLLGVGIGAPGLIDSHSGTVRWSVNLEWADLRLGPILGERTGLPVMVANDSQAAALTELTFFRRPRPQNLIVIRIGLGIGAGIVLNGQLYQGDGFGAGEIGHTVAVDDGEACHCGSFGCLETVASMRAMIAGAGRSDPAVRDEASLVAAFGGGNTGVREVVMRAAVHLGRAIASAIGTLNVHHVLLIGPAAGLGEEWLQAISSNAKARALQLLARDTTIEFGHVHDDVVLLGASAMLMTRQLGLSLTR